MDTGHPPRSVAYWLLGVYGMIFAMVIVGGVTRLTGSGLSMVDWHPLMGAIPPIGEADWLATFERYKGSPQYLHVNHWMELGDFKRIFLWEYLHRLLGRLIGLVFFLPWLAFAVKKKLPGRWLLKTAIAFVLGGSQGLLGWFMVKSGLVDRPEVSHFRLAAHLSLAFFVALYVLWLVMGILGTEAEEGPTRKGLWNLAWTNIGLLGLQIVYGAFMAGKRAGHLFATFPDMNGSLFPASAFSEPSLLGNLLDNPVFIHAFHRSFAYVATIVVVVTFVVGRRATSPDARRAVQLLLAGVVFQVVLGALTVMWHVPISVAVAHQAMALLLISFSLMLAHTSRSRPVTRD